MVSSNDVTMAAINKIKGVVPLTKTVNISAIFIFVLGLSACGGGESSSSTNQPSQPTTQPPPVSSPSPTPEPEPKPEPVPEPEPEPEPAPQSSSLLQDKASAQRFMAFAGFGASDQALEKLVGTDAADWLAAQLAMPYDSYLQRVLPKLQVEQPATRSSTTSTQRYQLEMFWDAAITGQDVLRQRMLFALSQIIVANETNRRQAHREAYYLDVLGRNAFGNYRDILTEITYTPLMGRYLTYLGNRKGNPENGRLPDENYAREILQLFSIGLVELNMDGTLKRSDTDPITGVETYTNIDIVNLARVFTGLVLDPSKQGPDAWYHPMKMSETRHSSLEKNFLDVKIPANTKGQQSIKLAIDGIFSHHNLAPFIARQLIQRFTQSHPSSDYIERVATAFEQGNFEADNGQSFGDGERGNLSATLAAILLEPSLFTPVSELSNIQTVGKIREPVLRFVHWARAFELSNVNSSAETKLRAPQSPSTGLAQRPFGSPSVFNFYRPGYVAPGTASGARGLTAPELQIVNTGSAIGFTNFMTDYIIDNTRSVGSTNTFIPNYSHALSLADNPQQLVDYLAMLLTADRMSQTSKDLIKQAVTDIGIRATEEQADRLARVELAIIMAVSDPTFTVIY